MKVNISAGEGLQDVLKSNLGPLGTIKMYVRPREMFGELMQAFFTDINRLVDGSGQVKRDRCARYDDGPVLTTLPD